MLIVLEIRKFSMLENALMGHFNLQNIYFIEMHVSLYKYILTHIRKNALEIGIEIDKISDVGNNVSQWELEEAHKAPPPFDLSLSLSLSVCA